MVFPYLEIFHLNTLRQFKIREWKDLQDKCTV